MALQPQGQPRKQATASRTTPACQTGTDQNRVHAVLTLLECPICFHFPRNGQLYRCSNGHVVCNDCFSSFQERQGRVLCPTCRDGNLTHDALVKQIADTLFTGLSLRCKHYTCGCDRKYPWQFLPRHEQECQFRKSRCPALFATGCQWSGTINTLIEHVKVNNCITLLRSTSGEAGTCFQSEFRDLYDLQNRSNHHRKPDLLVSRPIIPYLVYVTLHRSQRNHNNCWCVIVRSISPDHLLESIRFRLVICPDPENPLKRFTFEGRPISHRTTDSDAVAKGDYFALHDTQLEIRCDSLATLTDTELKAALIFQYKITISVGSEAEEPNTAKRRREQPCDKAIKESTAR